MTFAARLSIIPLLILGLFASAFAEDGYKLGDRGDVGWARSFITAHIAAIKSGDVAKVKSLLSERQRGKVTAAMVEAAKKEAAKYTIEELVASVQATPDEKAPTEVKIKMKNGRTLTTLIKVNGRWYADTLWFK
jgi:hypothetical protein